VILKSLAVNTGLLSKVLSVFVQKVQYFSAKVAAPGRGDCLDERGI
jgi:hypothetical protein